MKVPGSLVENVSTVVFPQRLSRREKKFHEIHTQSIDSPGSNSNKKVSVGGITEEEHRKFWQKVINDDAKEYQR